MGEIRGEVPTILSQQEKSEINWKNHDNSAKRRVTSVGVEPTACDEYSKLRMFIPKDN